MKLQQVSSKIGYKTGRNCMKIILAILLLFTLTLSAVVVIEFTLYDIIAQLEEMPTVVHPKVAKLMRYHGVTFFDWNEDRQEYGFWRGGKWCPAR